MYAKPQTVSVLLSGLSTNQQHPDIRIPLELTVVVLVFPLLVILETVAFNQHSGQALQKTAAAVDGVGPIAVSKLFAASDLEDLLFRDQ